MEGQRFTRTAIWLHWLIALGVVANIALAWTWPLADSHDGIIPYVRPMIDLHKSIGITILGLAMLRLLWRLGHKPPRFPVGYRPWERRAAHIVHWGLYAVIFAMPVTGWVMDSAYKDAALHPNHYFGTVEWPRLDFILNLPPDTRLWVHDTFGAAHGVIAWLVYALLALHLGGAIKHQMEGHKELRRMGLGRY